MMINEKHKNIKKNHFINNLIVVLYAFQFLICKINCRCLFIALKKQFFNFHKWEKNMKTWKWRKKKQDFEEEFQVKFLPSENNGR